MKLQNLIASIRESQNTKTASEAPAAAAAAPVPQETKLAAALREAVTASTETTKAASAGSPVADVMKVAAEIADGEKAAALKEAALLGAAYADAAIVRFAEWQKAASELPAVAAPVLGQKVAAVNSGAVQADTVFSKFAEENPIQARQALALGYAPTAGGLEKMAADSYVQGYNDQVSEIHKVASEEFLKGAALTSLIIEQSAK